jgi:hypothetical protein
LQQELGKDSINDPWEHGKSDYQPLVGILTQPVSESKKETFNHHDYILKINQDFVAWGGSKTIAIPFDISKK